MLIRDIECKEYKYDSSIPLRVRIGCYGILRNKEGKYLMIETNKQSGWEFPGGGCDLFESLQDCVIREVKEETGYSVRLIQDQPVHTIENFIYSRSKKEYWKKIDLLFLCELKTLEKSNLFLDEGESIFKEEWLTFKELKEEKWIYLIEEHKEEILQFL